MKTLPPEIIPRLEAIQARLEELGFVWDANETEKELEARLDHILIGVPPTFLVPPEAKESNCFGYFYTIDALPCDQLNCDLYKDCQRYTHVKFEERIFSAGTPRKRYLDYLVIGT